MFPKLAQLGEHEEAGAAEHYEGTRDASHLDFDEMMLTQTVSHPPRRRLKSLSIPKQNNVHALQNSSASDMDDFVTRVEAEFRGPLQILQLKQISLRLQAQFREKLDDSDICMLPSYNEALPTGDETGDYLAADVGGSNIRIARIRLHGRSKGKSGASELVRQWSFSIDDQVRDLPGISFFDWMANKIGQCLLDEDSKALTDGQSSEVIGLSWSFPLE